jgi:hypothetical protein
MNGGGEMKIILTIVAMNIIVALMVGLACVGAMLLEKIWG